MIIDYTTNSKNYSEKILEFYGIWPFECPSCHAKHAFHRHGTYNRHLLTLNNQSLDENAMDILRIKCSSCGHTHAILPIDVIPFHIYATTCILTICSKFYIEEKSILTISNESNISYQLIYKFLNIFNLFLNHIQHLLRQLEILKYSEQVSCQKVMLTLSLYESTTKFIIAYLKHYRSPLFLTRRCTSSYFFTIGF